MKITEYLGVCATASITAHLIASELATHMQPVWQMIKAMIEATL